MPIASDWQTFSLLFVERAINSIAEGLVLALFAWLLLRSLRKQNSSTRFAVCFSVAIVLAVLPFFDSAAFDSHTAAAASMPSAFHIPSSFAAYIFAAWALIAGVGLIRVLLGLWQVHGLKVSSTPVEQVELDPILQRTLNDFGTARPVKICVSDSLRVPTAIGFWRPAIVIPAWALQELDAVQLNSVLLHELAHLRRWDDWTNLAQQVLRALFFFHPAVWWLGRNLSLERELACDDFVLAATSNRQAYARCLVTVAEKSFLRRGLALAQAAVGRMSQTSQRVSRILNGKHPVATKIWKPALGLVGTVSAACLIAMPHTPQLVAFESAAPAFSASAVDTSERAGARMIPASFHPGLPAGPVETPASAKVARKSPRKAETKLALDRTESGRPAMREETSAKLLRTNANENGIASAQPRSASTVWFVTQTEQVDDSGNLVWSIRVWQLTLTERRPIQRAVQPKST